MPCPFPFVSIEECHWIKCPFWYMSKITKTKKINKVNLCAIFLGQSKDQSNVATNSMSTCSW